MVPLDSFSGGMIPRILVSIALGAYHGAFVDGFYDPLSKGILKPLGRIDVIEVNRRVVDNVFHITIVNC